MGQLLVIYFPPLQSVFQTESLSLFGEFKVQVPSQAAAIHQQNQLRLLHNVPKGPTCTGYNAHAWMHPESCDIEFVGGR